MDWLTKFVKYLSNEKHYSDNTISAYCSDLDAFAMFLQPQRNTSLSLKEKSELLRTAKDSYIRLWIEDLMENGRKPRTVNRKLATLSSFYHYLLREKAISVNPMQKIIKPKQTKPLPVFFSEKEMDAALESVFEDNYVGIRNKTILELFYATGIRLSELINIRYGDINFNQNTIKILGKGNKERIIPFTANFLPIIEYYLLVRKEQFGKIHAEDYLFLTEKGEKMYRKLVYRMVKQYIEAISTKTKCSPHVIRHTFATHLLEHGADINAIKTLLGHVSLSATQVYIHTTIDHLKKEYEQAHPRA